MRRSSKLPLDPNQAAALAVRFATEEPEDSSGKIRAISQYLATIGRKGGIKGGKERATRLSAERRSEIARMAAQVRWKGNGGVVKD